MQRIGLERTVALGRSWPTRAALTTLLLARMNRGEPKIDLADEARQWEDEKTWKQLRLARYRVPAPETMDMYVAATEGHDDFLMSIALLTEALSSFTAPPESG